MSNLDSNLALVNEQIEFHSKQAATHANVPYRHKRHIATADGFRAHKSWVEGLITQIAALQKELEAYLRFLDSQRKAVRQPLPDIPRTMPIASRARRRRIIYSHWLVCIALLRA